MREKCNGLIKTAVKDIAILAAGSAVGLLALFAVYLLPVSPAQEHVWQSLDMLEAEFEKTDLLEGYPATMTGSFTDCLMLGCAVYDGGGHSAWEQAFYAYRAESGQGDGWATGKSLVDYLCKTGAEWREEEYSRYWHGYLVVLKPLLCLTTVGSIRALASFVQLLLFGAVMMLCGMRGERRLAAAFGFSMPFLYFFSLYASLSLSICFYLMAAAVILQLKWHEKLMAGGYGEFFLLTGMAAAYFDLLTYPLIVLGFPLCIYLYLESESPKKSLCRMAGFSARWSGGYLGFWAIKWFLTDLLAGGVTLSEAVGTLAQRTDTAEGMPFLRGFCTVLRENITAYANWAFVLLGLLIALWGFYCVAKAGRGFWTKAGLLNRGVILLAACFPLVWYGLAQNHSHEHAVFTYRILSLSVFAVCCAVGKKERAGQ